MKILKLLIKTSFVNKINDFLCFDIIKYIFNRRSNKVLVSYIIKINTFHQDVLHSYWALTSITFHLQWQTDRKLYKIYRMVLFSVTSNDP